MGKFSVCALLMVFLISVCTPFVAAQIAAPDPMANPNEYLMSLDGKVQVSWMTWSAEKNVTNRMEQIFAVYPNLRDKIELVYVSGGANVREMIQKLTLAVMAGSDIPTIIEGSGSTKPALVENRLVRDLTKAYQPILPHITDTALKLVSYNDQIIGFPGQINCKLWFYRQDMFQTAGIDPGVIDSTEAFIEAGKKLQAVYPDAYLWNYEYPTGATTLEFWLSGSPDKRLFDPDSGLYNIVNNQSVRILFEDLKRIRDSGVVQQLGMSSQAMQQAIRDNQLASVMSAIWFKNDSNIPTWVPEQQGQWAVTTCPPILGSNGGGSDSGGSFYCIPNGCDNPDAGIAIMSLLCFDYEVNMNVFKHVNSAIEPQTDYGRLHPDFVQSPYFHNLTQAIHDAYEIYGVVDYSPAAMTEFTILTQYLDLFLTGHGTLDDLLQQCENDMNTQIGNPYSYAY